MTQDKYDVIIVGAGPAGVGVAIILEKLGLNYIVLEKDAVGSSFRKWPKETRFISPSFTGNFFKMPDLNAISPTTSPAYGLQTEHPTGAEYAEYLEEISEFFEINIQNNVTVKDVKKSERSFALQTSQGEFESDMVVWAGGEYQYPKTKSFDGDDLCIHYASVSSFADIEGDDIIIIGAYESGFDTAVNLCKLGKKVRLLDSSNYVDLINSDSSYSLSPHTRDRIREAGAGIQYHKETRVQSVTFSDGVYTVTTESGKTFTSPYKPINCTGFDSSLKLVKELFEFSDGYPLLDEVDQSVKTKNLFLAGPQVKHKNALFCFIYKYRQRFAIVAEAIAKKKRLNPKKVLKVLKEYKENNFYLDDLSCCDDKCEC